MQLIPLRTFQKSFQKLPSPLKKKVGEKLKIFTQDPFHPLLYNHALKWSKEWLRTINITGDYRLVFYEISEGKYELVELVDVGTHAQLYG